MTASELIAQAADEILAVLRRQHYRGVDIARDLGIRGGLHALVSMQLNFMAFDYDLDFAGCAAEHQVVSIGNILDTAITAITDHATDGLEVTLYGNTDLFDQDTIAGWMGMWRRILDQLVADPDLPVGLIKAQLPSWIHLTSPVSPPVDLLVPPSNGEAQTIPFELTVDAREPKCVDQPARVHIIEVNDADRGHAVLTIRDPKVDKRTDCGFKFTPNQLPGFGLSMLSLRDDRMTDTEVAGWAIDPLLLPDWLTVNPLEGTLRLGEADPVVFAGAPPYEPCLGRPEIHYPVFAVATLFDGTSLDARMVLVYPPVAALDCSDPNARSGGDPHMVSFDGVPWEAQTLGEYLYVQTLSLIHI